ncbi:MAG: DNA adenine methylase [Pyrinomonadaceae bacterium]
MKAAIGLDFQISDAPHTQGIKYTGSKLRLLPYIIALAQKTNSKHIFDGFAGTTRVSQAFAKSNFTVTANDSAIWSKVFAECFLLNNKPKDYYQEIIAHLNSLLPRTGWFTENYGADARGIENKKRPFQKHNMMKLDAIRDEIDSIAISGPERSVLLTSLILALDKVDSTLGHYASYLRNWSERSFNTFEMKVPELLDNNRKHNVFCANIFDILNDVEADIAYFDPPYGSNNEKMPPSRVRYSAYYHFWKSVVLNDKPKLFGKANRREDSRDIVNSSIFEEFRKDQNDNFIAVEALRELIAKVKAPHVILSYSSGGRATAENLFEIIEDSGEIADFIKVNYKQNVMASMRWTNDWIRETKKPNQEFLFLIKKK